VTSKSTTTTTSASGPFISSHTSHTHRSHATPRRRLSCFNSTCNRPNAFLFSHFCRSQSVVQSPRYPTDIWFAFRCRLPVNNWKLCILMNKMLWKIAENMWNVNNKYALCMASAVSQVSSCPKKKRREAKRKKVRKRPTVCLRLCQRLVSSVGSAVTSSSSYAKCVKCKCRRQSFMNETDKEKDERRNK